MGNTSQILTRPFSRFLRDQSGASAIEYVVIAALLSISIAATVVILGDTLDAEYFQQVADQF